MPFAPTDITGNKLWLPADLESYADNDSVGTATDRSGLGNNGTQATAGFKPTYKTGIVNGKAVYRFDGTDDFLSLPNLLSGASAGEIFIVVKVNVDPPAGETGLWKFGTETAATHFPYADGNIYDGWGSTARKTVGNPTPSLASWRLYDVSSAAGAWTARLDGAQIFTTATNTVGFDATPAIGRSINFAAVTYFLPGDIAEVIAYDSVLSSTDRASVQNYLAAKYGLAIPIPSLVIPRRPERGLILR